MSHYAATLQDTAQKVKSHYIAFVNSSQFEVSFLLATRELILVNCVCLSRPAVKCLSVSSDCVLGWAQSSQETLELTDQLLPTVTFTYLRWFKHSQPMLTVSCSVVVYKSKPGWYGAKKRPDPSSQKLTRIFQFNQYAEICHPDSVHMISLYHIQAAVRCTLST